MNKIEATLRRVAFLCAQHYMHTQTTNKISSGQWANPILNDLTHIKKYLRYPFNKKTITVLISLLLLSAWAIRILFTTKNAFQRLSHTTKPSDFLFVLIFVCLLIFPIVNYMRRGLQSLQFVAIPNSYTEARNIELLVGFLQKEHFAYEQHPEAPEVFQMSSRVLDASSGWREILVFIADDNRILLNSHFVNKKGFRYFRFVNSSQRNKMAKALQQWLSQQQEERKGAYTTIGTMHIEHQTSRI